MPSGDVPAVKAYPPLDPSLYPLADDPEALAFFKEKTGIRDDDELKEHILRVTSKAYEVHKYPCIRNFGFLKLKISRLPAYREVLELSRRRKDAILLDIGCCFGNDTHKAAADGWPAENIVGSDLRRGYWEAGHDLFKTTPTSFPATFIEGDIFDPKFILIPSDGAAINRQLAPGPRPVLSSLTSLNPLKGHVSAIHASSFFHLFSEDRQRAAAAALAALLLPAPGSTIFGSHRGSPTKGYPGKSVDPRFNRMFCHTPGSWKAIWVGGEGIGGPGIFGKGEVEVNVHLRAYTVVVDVGVEESMHVLIWSVTRL